MNVEVVLLEHLAVDAKLLMVSLNPLKGYRCRLLHHIAKVTRKRELTLTRCEYRLNI